MQGMRMKHHKQQMAGNNNAYKPQPAANNYQGGYQMPQTSNGWQNPTTGNNGQQWPQSPVTNNTVTTGGTVTNLAVAKAKKGSGGKKRPKK